MIKRISTALLIALSLTQVQAVPAFLTRINESPTTKSAIALGTAAAALTTFAGYKVYKAGENANVKAKTVSRLKQGLLDTKQAFVNKFNTVKGYLVNKEGQPVTATWKTRLAVGAVSAASVYALSEIVQFIRHGNLKHGLTFKAYSKIAGNKAPVVAVNPAPAKKAVK